MLLLWKVHWSRAECFCGENFRHRLWNEKNLTFWAFVRNRSVGPVHLLHGRGRTVPLDTSWTAEGEETIRIWCRIPMFSPSAQGLCHYLRWPTQKWSPTSSAGVIYGANLKEDNRLRFKSTYQLWKHFKFGISIQRFTFWTHASQFRIMRTDIEPVNDIFYTQHEKLYSFA